VEKENFMYLKSLFVFVALIVLGRDAQAGIQCSVVCGVTVTPILDHVSNPSGYEAAAFREACASRHGAVAQGSSNGGSLNSCGDSHDFFCVGRSSSERAEGSGSDASEVVAREQARKACFDALPSMDCVNYHFAGSKGVISSNCGRE
jgi:hypothetical protein